MDIKKILDSAAGQKKSNVKIIGRTPYSANKFVLRFTMEIKSARYETYDRGDHTLYLTLNIGNRTIDDVVDDDDFDFRFQGSLIQDLLSERIHNEYKLDLFGLDEHDVEITYEYL